ncbi:MAG: PIN domain-containing protein, partial [Chitinophagaceae bacterium]|nr:PIN domain-containing protein [Chitinophagaceae bacterium]
MTGSRYALDTNIISAWLANKSTVPDRIDSAQNIFIPVIVVGELYYGAQYSTKVEQNLNNISKALSYYPMLMVDGDTCRNYGLIKAALRKKGKPIPENDIWIAALVMQH